jgi:hypothetical protein
LNTIDDKISNFEKITNENITFFNKKTENNIVNFENKMSENYCESLLKNKEFNIVRENIINIEKQLSKFELDCFKKINKIEDNQKNYFSSDDNSKKCIDITNKNK